MKFVHLAQLVVATSILFSTSALANGAEVIRQYIGSALPDLPQCSQESNSIKDSMENLLWSDFPTHGKFVLVNIPGASLTAYSDGEPVMEMKVVVGSPKHPTPVQETQITEVRLNPTWTVPYSIVRDEGWKDRLNKNPDFFTRNNFEFHDGNGGLLTLEEAQSDPDLVAHFVQAPGRYNALGEYRFNIQSSQAIYLHDTRDREAFDEDGPMALSHGCVRIQKPRDFALWLLDLSEDEVDELRSDGVTVDIKLPEPVPIVLGYFTAWPDAAGNIVIYEDIYNREQNSCSAE